MNCDFDIDAAGVATCKRPGCGRVVRGAKGKIAAACKAGGADEIPPSVGVLAAAISYVKSQISHLWSGESVPAAERDARHSTCKRCDKYDGSRCALCGCMANSNPNYLVNKLATARPEWPVIKNIAGEILFECPQIKREKAQ